MYVLALEGRPQDLQGYLLKADGCQMCYADWLSFLSDDGPLPVKAEACRAVSVPLSIVGARHLERSSFACQCWKTPAEACRLSNGRVRIFAKATNRTHKSRQHTGPTRSKSNIYSLEEQIDVGCVPGMNGSALGIFQSVRDAAHITITVPQTCRFLNARAKTMSSITL